MSNEAVGAELSVRVWDIPTRLFHWSLVILLVVGWLTGEGEGGTAQLHRIAGEVVAGLLVFRLIWGFVGGEHARFADFAAGPNLILKHVGNLFSAYPKRHLGHNPLGGLAVFLLLLVTAVIVVTGLFSEHPGMGGPFAVYGGEGLVEIHELAFRVLQGLVVVHILGVIAESFLSKDALAPAMVTGVKRRRADEAGADARRASAVALVVSLALAIGATAGLIVLNPPASDPAAGEHANGAHYEPENEASDARGADRE